MRKIEVGSEQGGGGGGWGQGGCVRGIEVIVKMQKSRGWGLSRGSGWGSGSMCTKN